MPRFVCHHDGWFFEWSTVTDSPVTAAMTRDEFVSYYVVLHGKASMPELEERLARAVAKGTSSMMDESLRDLVAGNRVGPDGSETALGQPGATLEQIIAMVVAERACLAKSKSN